MSRKKLIWQLFPSYLLITILTVIAISFYIHNEFRKFYLEDTASGLESRAKILSDSITPELLRSPESVNDLCYRIGRKSSTRITVILPDGSVIADSEEPPELMDNYNSRAEIKIALSGDTGRSIRLSDTLKEMMMYIAVPVYDDSNSIIAVVRTAIPVTSINQTLQTLLGHVLIVGLALVALGMIFVYISARKITRPIEELKSRAEEIAAGNFKPGFVISNTLEIAALSEAMDKMGTQLNERIKTVIQQRNEKEAILSSMVEGVIAVNNEERIIEINRAAANLFDTDIDSASGKLIQEVVRNSDLQNFVKDSLGNQKTFERDIVMRGPQEKFLQVLGTPLVYDKGKRFGVLVVLNDVTRIRKLENFRRDFVANVSHELKTPVTSIKGFVETLLDGALENTDEAVRFLKIVLKQADSLNAIISDLLSLSRLEKESEYNEIQLDRGDIRAVLKSAILTCQNEASKRNIKIELTCQEDLSGDINNQLLEQAVTNLLNNAIKHSDADSEIIVSAAELENGTRISVKDFGCGIAKEHLPRLFERFYRVDKSRSRELGGTGLGLAIVKHIAQVHGGTVEVKSKLQEGSEFTIILPKKTDNKPHQSNGNLTIP